MVVSFDSAVVVLHDPVMLFAVGVVWLLPLIVWLIIGFVVSAKTISGRKVGLLVESPNFWLVFLVFGLLQGLLFLLLLVFPVQLWFFGG